MEGLRDVGFVSSLSGLRGGLRTVAPSSQTHLAGTALAWGEGMSPTSVQPLSPGSLRGTSQFIGVEENLQEVMSTPWHSSPSDTPVRGGGFEDSLTISQTQRPYSAATSPRKCMGSLSPAPAADSHLAYLNLAEASRGGVDPPEVHRQHPPLQHSLMPRSPRALPTTPTATFPGGVGHAGDFTIEEGNKEETMGLSKVVHSPIPSRVPKEDYETRNMVSGEPVGESWDFLDQGGDSTALRTELARLTVQYKDAQEAIERAHQQVEEQSLHSAKLQRRIKALEGEAENQNDKLLKAEQAVLDCHEKLSKKEGDLKAQGNQLHLARQQYEALERDAKVMQEEVEKENMKCQALEDKLANAKDDMVALQKEIAQEHRKQQTWSADERKMNSLVETFRKENQRLEEALEKKDLEVASLKDRQKGAAKDAEGISKILQQAQYENAMLAKENASQKRTIMELEASVSKLEDTVALSREEMVELQYRCRELEGSAFKMVPDTYNQHQLQLSRQRPSQPQSSRKFFPWQHVYENPHGHRNTNALHRPTERHPSAAVSDFSTRTPAYDLTNRQGEIYAPSQRKSMQFDLPPQSGYSRDQVKVGFADMEVGEERERRRSDMHHDQDGASPNQNLPSSNEDAREERPLGSPPIEEPKHHVNAVRQMSPIVGSEWGDIAPTSDWHARGGQKHLRQDRTLFGQSVKESMRRTKILEDHLMELGLEKKQLECEYVKMPPYGGRTLNAITRKQLVEGRLEEIGREISQIRLELKMLASLK